MIARCLVNGTNIRFQDASGSTSKERKSDSKDDREHTNKRRHEGDEKEERESKKHHSEKYYLNCYNDPERVIFSCFL